ncbi:MAG: hypothetical protein HY695_21080 [Deltaproteobacteria bacterium]|nr:hypothetical protein [Deltaproteobacteria bacterium]
MSEKQLPIIQVTCPCCGAMLTIDPTLRAVLEHKLPVKPQLVAQLKDAARLVEQEAVRRQERYQQIVEAEKNKGKVLDKKFQELLKRAKEEPLEKPLKDIDLD